jgi:hypothetical protein
VAESIFSGSSTLGDVEFSFDDQIVNSQAYRRVLGRLSAGQSQSLQTAMKPIPESNIQNSRFSTCTIEQIPQPDSVGSPKHSASDDIVNKIQAVIIGISIGWR